MNRKEYLAGYQAGRRRYEATSQDPDYLRGYSKGLLKPQIIQKGNYNRPKPWKGLPDFEKGYNAGYKNGRGGWPANRY